LHARAEQGDGNNLKIVKFLTVAAKHCRKAEHSLQLAAGSFNIATRFFLHFNFSLDRLPSKLIKNLIFARTTNKNTIKAHHPEGWTPRQGR
jgi:hypothetical protein